MKTLKYDDFDFYVTDQDDLLGVSKGDKKKYLLSIFNGLFSVVSVKDVEGREWCSCSKDKVKEIIQNTKDAIVKRAKLNDPEKKLHSVVWWDDPDDYYFGNDTYKLSFNLFYGEKLDTAKLVF